MSTHTCIHIHTKTTHTQYTHASCGSLNLTCSCLLPLGPIFFMYESSKVLWQEALKETPCLKRVLCPSPTLLFCCSVLSSRSYKHASVHLVLVALCACLFTTVAPIITLNLDDTIIIIIIFFSFLILTIRSLDLSSILIDLCEPVC